jgi:Spy/CpxP family protein refolding chaperone
MMKKYTLWIILSLAVVFALGIAAGVFGQRYITHKGPGRPAPRQHAPSLDAFAKELGLTADQQSRIRDIFKKNEERMKLLWGEEHKRLDEVRAQLKADIDTVLTPEQKVLFEAMIRKHNEESKNRAEREGRNREENQRNNPQEKR